MEQSPYRAALAHIHDDGFGFIATGAAKLLLAGLKLQGFSEGLVVELACGSGISSRMVVDGGYDVLGFDMSADMIELAQARVPEARFETVSLYDAELPECVAVTGIGEAFNYRFDERAGEEEGVRRGERLPHPPHVPQERDVVAQPLPGQVCVEMEDERERVQQRQQHAAGDEPGVEAERSNGHAGDLWGEDMDVGCAIRRAVAPESLGR